MFHSLIKVTGGPKSFSYFVASSPNEVKRELKMKMMLI